LPLCPQITLADHDFSGSRRGAFNHVPPPLDMADLIFRMAFIVAIVGVVVGLAMIAVAAIGVL